MIKSIKKKEFKSNIGRLILIFISAILFLSFINLANAEDNVTIKNEASLSKRVFGPEERMVLRGYLYSATINSTNSSVSSYSAITNATINVTIYNIANGLNVSNFTLNTSSAGEYFSRSDFDTGAKLINAPGSEGYYKILATYKDNNNISWPFRMDFLVVNKSVDDIQVFSDKASYYAWETIKSTVETTRFVGNTRYAITNLSVVGNIRDSSRARISTFNCTTGSDGRCTVSGLSVPPTIGNYIIEVGNYSGVSSFRVVAFDAAVYMKDDSGTNYKNTFNPNQEANVEVIVSFNNSIPIRGAYTFTGNITNITGSVIREITTTSLNTNNSFKKAFKLLLNNNFTTGSYIVNVRVTDGSNVLIRSTSFDVRDWTLSFQKSEVNSGFDYEYSAFPNTGVSFDILPIERANGTLILNLSQSLFNITLENNLNKIINSTNITTYNSSCANSGCYKFAIRLPSVVGNYKLNIAVNYSDEIISVERTITVVNLTMTVTPGNIEGQLKELFGTTESVYFTTTTKNQTSPVNVSTAKLDSVLYENGTYLTYNEVSTWALVNNTNDVLEWAWNITNQRLKLDIPKAGGSYLVSMSADNGTAIGSGRFYVNPYESCIAAKTTTGTVGSGSYYAWQYKVSDTVYFEIKLVQADNPNGKFQGSNGSSTYSGYSAYGMGSACNFDTTKKQVVNNATITVDEVINTQTGIKSNLNITASNCKSDDESGGYTCTIKHINDSWDGGRYSVKLKILGQDGKTSDISYGTFEAKAFYLWAWSNNWNNKPASNISLNVNMYEAGSNWWNSWGSNGLTGTVKVEKVQYFGKAGEWNWPPITYDYNTTGNDTIISSGAGTVFLNTSKIKKGRWESGSYSVILKGTDDASGNTDYGEAWFEIRNWDSYAMPVGVDSTSNFVYKYYYGSKENISLFVRVSAAGDYSWASGGASLVDDGSNITITVKKIMDYSSWPTKELDPSTYSVTNITINSSSPYYSSATRTSHSNYLLNISNLNGSWNTGYYNVVLDINGTETGWGWFNTIAFYATATGVDSAGNSKYNIKSGPAYFFTSTTKGQKTSYNATTDYINTTIKDIELKRWSDTDYRYIEYEYIEDFNVSNTEINGSRIISLNYTTDGSSNWPGGYYYGSITLKNDDNETSTAYLWFNVQSFRVQFTTDSYNIGVNDNVTGLIKVLDPDWSNSSIIWGNYTITEVYSESWNYYTRTRTAITDFSPRNFNGSTNLSIVPNSAWDPTWGNFVITVFDNITNNSKNVWVSYKAELFTTSFGSITNQNDILSTANVTIPITLTSPKGGSATGNVTRIYENIWPNELEYEFTVENTNCTSVTSSSCIINGSADVIIHAPSGGWTDGYRYPQFVIASHTDLNVKTTESGGSWFRVTPPYSGYFYNNDENFTWRYNVGFNDNAILTMYVTNASGSKQNASIQYIQHSFDQNCNSDYCRTWANITWSNYANNSIGGQIISITNSGIWERGQHAIKVGVTGPLGTSVIKTGYFYAKDNTAPNITSVDFPPYHGYKVNTTDLQVNWVLSEPASCSLIIFSYDDYFSSHCGNSNTADGSGNVSSVTFFGSCDNTIYNGSLYTYSYFLKSSYPSTFLTDRINQSFTIPYISNYAQQDYALHINCWDDDYNSASGYRIFEKNITINENSTNITMLYTSQNHATPSYVNADSFTVYISAGGGIENFTYYLYNSSYNVVNSTRVSNATANFTWYVDFDRNEVYNYTVIGTALNGTNISVANKSITFDNTTPLISYTGSTSGNNTSYNRTWIYVNVSVTELHHSNITFSLSYSNHSLINSTNFSSVYIGFAPALVINWTSLTINNTYLYNVTYMDKATNANYTETRLIILNLTNTTST